MEELVKRKDIITTNAGKGNAVVIMFVEKQINETNRQLSNKRNQKKSQEDPRLQHSNLVNDTIDRFKTENLFSKQLADRPIRQRKNPKVLHFTQDT